MEHYVSLHIRSNSSQSQNQQSEQILRSAANGRSILIPDGGGGQALQAAVDPTMRFNILDLKFRMWQEYYSIEPLGFIV